MTKPVEEMTREELLALINGAVTNAIKTVLCQQQIGRRMSGGSVGGKSDAVGGNDAVHRVSADGISVQKQNPTKPEKSTQPSLTHPFKDQCDAVDLLDGCDCLNSFCGKLEWQAVEKSRLEVPDPKMEEQRTEFVNKFKGDGLECLVEFIVKQFGVHPHIGITDYEIVPVSDDTGVDGKGKSALDGKPATVQVKYRQANHLLTANADHLTNFAWASVRRYGVEISSTDHMLIFTTAEDVHHFTKQQMLDGAVKILNRQALRELSDGMTGFWEAFKEALLSSRTERAWVKPIELREHQTEAVAAMRAAIESGANKGIVELPTGTGKTLVQAGLIAALEGKE